MTTYTSGQATPAPSPGDRRPMSAEEIRAVVLPRTAVGRRGYRDEDVHELLTQLAADAEHWSADNARLLGENERLKEALRSWQSEHGGDAAPSAEREAAEVLERAQRQAEATVAQAQDYARGLIEQARAQAEELTREARRTAIDAEEAERRAARLRSVAAVIAGLEAQLRAAREGLLADPEPDGESPTAG
jgi:DivIVA domain-containing protein